MIIEKILHGRPAQGTGKRVETVSFEWFEQNQKILAKVSSAGESVALRLCEPLFDGAVLFEDEERVIALSLLPCKLIRVEVFTMKEMGRACFELGNRHLPLFIGENVVCVPHDEPTFEYLKKLGFCCTCVTERFVPDTAAGHAH